MDKKLFGLRASDLESKVTEADESEISFGPWEERPKPPLELDRGYSYSYFSGMYPDSDYEDYSIYVKEQLKIHAADIANDIIQSQKIVHENRLRFLKRVDTAYEMLYKLFNDEPINVLESESGAHEIAHVNTEVAFGGGSEDDSEHIVIVKYSNNPEDEFGNNPEDDNFMAAELAMRGTANLYVKKIYRYDPFIIITKSDLEAAMSYQEFAHLRIEVSGANFNQDNGGGASPDFWLREIEEGTCFPMLEEDMHYFATKITISYKDYSYLLRGG